MFKNRLIDSWRPVKINLELVQKLEAWQTLLGMRHDSRYQVSVILNYEVKAPISIHARLPKVESLAVLFARSEGCDKFSAKRRTCLSKAFWIWSGAFK